MNRSMRYIFNLTKQKLFKTPSAALETKVILLCDKSRSRGSVDENDRDGPNHPEASSSLSAAHHRTQMMMMMMRLCVQDLPVLIAVMRPASVYGLV